MVEKAKEEWGGRLPPRATGLGPGGVYLAILLTNSRTPFSGVKVSS